MTGRNLAAAFVLTLAVATTAACQSGTESRETSGPTETSTDPTGVDGGDTGPSESEAGGGAAPGQEAGTSPPGTTAPPTAPPGSVDGPLGDAVPHLDECLAGARSLAADGQWPEVHRTLDDCILHPTDDVLVPPAVLAEARDLDDRATAALSDTHSTTPPDDVLAEE